MGELAQQTTKLRRPDAGRSALFEPIEESTLLPPSPVPVDTKIPSGSFPAPALLSGASLELWHRYRVELLGGRVATASAAIDLAKYCDAEVQLLRSREEVKQQGGRAKKNYHGQTVATPAARQEKYWAHQHTRLFKAVRKLFAKSTTASIEAPANPWTELVRIDSAQVANNNYISIFVARAEDYVDDVLEGVIPASQDLIAACRRHRSDLSRSRANDPDFPFEFNLYLAHRPCAFISELPHVKGQWARTEQTLHLENWECFLLCSLFGWVHKESKLRRFREAYWEICRKNGKSILAAGIGLFMLCADGEHGAEIYSGATTEKQAWEVFRPARLMALKTPKLLLAAGITVHAKYLIRGEDASRFEPMIGRPGDGASPSLAIIDEFHEHQVPDMVDTMQTGMVAREQPILLKITTAGYNLAGPCYESRTKALSVVRGALQEETLFVVVYGIDLPNASTGEKGDDWASPLALRKANPNLGISIDEQSLLVQQRSAVMNVSEQTKFKTKHLNVWCAARTQWISLQQWNLAGDAQLTPDELKGSTCWFMFDLASKSDIAAYMLLFRRRLNALDHYYIFGRYYLPEDAVHEASKNQLMYQKWHQQGLLTLTSGATTDFERIKDDIVADARIYQPNEVVYDPFNATHMSQLLMGEGLNLVEFTQAPANFAVPMDEIQAALKDGRLHHDGNEMLTWMISNVTVRPAKKGLFWPTKESPELKIDGPVAMIMGIGRALGDTSDAALDSLFGGAVTA